MRELTSHKINGCNEAINIIVMDGPGPGGAPHHYRIEPITDSHPQGAINPVDLKFQNGAIKEAGVNGVTHEALLAILEDRLWAFQEGPYKCAENELALFHIQSAQSVLQSRTKARMARNVEGTMAV